jgi:hypothetical protein
MTEERGIGSADEGLYELRQKPWEKDAEQRSESE